MAPTITKDTPVVQLHAKTHFPIKLISTNFSIWQRQVRSMLIALDLIGYVDGTLHAPPKVLEGAANPCYSIWFRQDQSIIGALLGSCSDQVQPLISTCETACEAWTNLHAAFASSSRGRIVSLKSKLGKNPKGDRSMSDYLFYMQSIANELALVQSPVSEEDLVVHVLNQVGDEYDSITSAARVRAEPLSFKELGDILKEHEKKIQLSEATRTLSLATANYTQQQSGGGGSSRFGQHHRDEGRDSGSSANRRGRGQTTGRPARQTAGSGCQFCSIPGHDVRDCRKLARFLRQHGLAPPPVAHSTEFWVAVKFLTEG
ncbi:unnamed protein product [Cuscuta campestris]|uniref:Retrotransposon Copia-like N-terminal domain-containing protein n=1 Tax=Cuscuta campestris TaxID=132261 RepID=A0A484M460_9ASTE|nr:unnamed protein product [Cuscuta campestris]